MRNDIIKYFTIKNYKKDEIIKNEGDECNSIGIILEGNIYISNILNNFNEFIINRLSKNDMFGESLIFSSVNKYPGTIYSLSNCKIAFINKNNFLELLSIDEQFKLYYLEYISNKFIDLQTRIKVLSQPTLIDKLLYFFKIELKKTSLSYITIKSVNDLANYFNVPRPSLSRALSQLITEGIIKKENKKIFIIKKVR